MTSRKITFSAVLFFLICLCVVVGQFLGAAVYFKLTDIPLDYLAFSSLYDNWIVYGKNEAVRPFLEMGTAVATFITFLPVLVGSIVLLTKNKEEIHGSARFANDSELTKSGHFPIQRKAPSLLLGKMNKGKFKGRYVELEGQQFLGVSAPTGSGKGVGIVIPNMVNYSDSIVNTDIKLENFIKTGGYRQSQGQDVFLFAPDGYALTEDDRENAVLRSHRWNPFHYVRRQAEYRIGDIQVLAKSLYPLTGDAKADIWPASAGRVFLGLSLWMLDTEEITGQTPTMPYLISLRGVEGGLVPWMKHQLQQGYLSEECELEFNIFIETHEETRSGILTNFDVPLEIFTDKVVASAVSGNDFDFRELRRKGMTIFVGVNVKSGVRTSGCVPV